MAINWTTLTGAKTVSGSIANWVNRSDLPTENILLEAEAWIYSYLRTREMMTEEVLRIRAGNGTVDNNSATVLIDNQEVFNTGAGRVGATIDNVTDGSRTTIASVDSATQITTNALTGGTNNTWTAGDEYDIKGTAVFHLTSLSNTFLDPIRLRPFEWGRNLTYVHEDQLLTYRDSGGLLTEAETPTHWTIRGEDIYVDVDLTENFGCHMTYYFQPEGLSVTNETNFITIRYPTMLRYACLAFAYEHMKDSALAQNYFGMAMNKIMEANTTNELYRRTQEFPA